jgi:hypothetical protein
MDSPNDEKKQMPWWQTTLIILLVLLVIYFIWNHFKKIQRRQQVSDWLNFRSDNTSFLRK